MRRVAPFFPRLAPILALSIIGACTGGGGGRALDAGRGAEGGSGADGGVEPGNDGSLRDSPLCGAAYPAQACDGDPHGQWTLAALCVNRYEDCAGARVRTTGSATASIAFSEGWPEAQFEYSYDFDLETRLSVPASCLGGASCETIGCFGGADPCSCILGSSQGGSASNVWTPDISGEVVAHYGIGGQPTPVHFCAGETLADSEIGGKRLIWERVCTEGMDCRPSNPCQFGEARCAGDSIRCDSTGENRPVGSVCGTERVCDAAGECVPCAAGSECALDDKPCRVGVISCATAQPVCTAKQDRPDGTACGEGRRCLSGVCKAEDGAPCTTNGECDEACTCGDPQCLTRYCGTSCPCRHAPPGGACAGPLDEGTQDPASCQKACFQGRCLADVGQRCARDAECGSGHCTCWLSSCNGGRLCSKVACPCQWASSGAEACNGPLMDGLGDLDCALPQMCMAGACQ